MWAGYNVTTEFAQRFEAIKEGQNLTTNSPDVEKSMENGVVWETSGPVCSKDWY